MPATANDWVGLELAGGRYRVISKIGEGGMGLVYRARDHNLDSDVIIKVPRRALLEDEQFSERFAREIRSLVRLAHPHIVKAIEVGERDGVPFAVMQYLGGGSLKDRRRARLDGNFDPMQPQELLGWLPGVASALDFIHAQNYVHRDIKPSNILFDPHGHVYLSDFGVAKSLAGSETGQSASLTATGVVLGTAEFMAPELIMGHPYDGRADQYALAVTIYQCLCGRSPFVGLNPSAIMVKHMTEEGVPVHRIHASISEELSGVVMKALCKDANQRYPTSGSFAGAVIRAVAVKGGCVAVQPSVSDGPHVPKERLGKASESSQTIPLEAGKRARAMPTWIVALLLLSVVGCIVSFGLIQLRTRSIDNDIKAAGPPTGPMDAIPFIDRGIAWAKNQEHDKAIKEFEEAIRLDSKNIDAFINRGNAWSAKREYDKAIKDYDEAIRLNPKNALAFTSRGLAWNAIAFTSRGFVWRDRKEYDKAMKDFDEAIRLNPKDTMALNNRGLTWMNKREPHKAMKDFDEAIRLNPKDAMAFNNRGLTWMNKSEPDKAMKDFEEAIRLDPRNSAAFINRGNVYFGKKEYDMAMKDHDEAIRLDPKNARAFNQRGNNWMAKKEYDKAIKDYNEVIQLIPDDIVTSGTAFYWKACCYALQGRTDLAIDNFQHSLELALPIYMERVNSLDSIRGDPRFKELLKKYGK